MARHGFTLTGQTAIVTGASSGIGKACAIALGRAGAKVAVNYRSDGDGAEDTCATIRIDGGEATAIAGDVSREDDVRRLVATAHDTFGSVDILVNNAGIQKDVAFVDMTLEDWNAVLSVNLTGQFLCARECLRVMLGQGIRDGISRAAGKIICMSSVHQFIPWAGHANYAAAKGGVKLLAETLAQAYAPQRVRVNLVAPGAIRTNINRDVWSGEEGRATMLSLIPYGRIGDAEDVASVVAWLASDASDYVTGSTIVVDGGMQLYPGFREGG